MNPMVPWHEQIAAGSLARWDEVCRREGWGQLPGNRTLLSALFGASWYLTRFLFYSGRATAARLDQCEGMPTAAQLTRTLHDCQPGADLEALRIARNQLLLELVAADLMGTGTPELLEQRLSLLAEATLHSLLRHYGLERLVVLGMGRLGLREMHYGSDLDLILLYPDQDTDYTQEISAMLRACQLGSPAGSLYDIDVRLRPHGKAGTLVSRVAAFQEYHLGPREGWERQTLSRCRVLQDYQGQGAALLQRLRAHIYDKLAVDAPRAEDITALRGRVQHQLGSVHGQQDIKRGRGGLMDIDFLVQFLQLQQGGRVPILQGAGTRDTLTLAIQHGLLDAEQGRLLLDGYAFLKQLEARLRLFDMRASSRFSTRTLPAMARAMGMGDAADPSAALLQEYARTTTAIRSVFKACLGDPEADSGYSG